MGNLVFQATLGGQVNFVGPNTASTYNINVPTVNGTFVTTGDTGTVTNTMLAGSIANAKLTNSSVTIGSTSISLGATSTTLAGLTSVGTTTVGAPSSSNLSIQSNGTTNATLDTSGNLGLGVTPSAWGTGYKAIDIGLAGSVYADTAYATLIISANVYNTVANPIYKQSSVGATKYTQYNGAHSWYNAGSGTAGGTISFTQAMTLDASGNLLVGTTSGSSKGTIYQSADNIGLIVRNANASNTSNVLNVSADRNTTNNSYYFIRCDVVGVAYRFQVADSGNVTNTNNSYGAISDIKLKENITDATPKLDGLMQVRVRNYNLKSEPEHKQLGVIAQELEQVFPGMVEETPDRDEEGNDLGTTTKSVKYSVFVPMLIKAIQEQQAIITQLQSDVEALKAPK